MKALLGLVAAQEKGIGPKDRYLSWFSSRERGTEVMSRSRSGEDIVEVITTMDDTKIERINVGKDTNVRSNWEGKLYMRGSEDGVEEGGVL